MKLDRVAFICANQLLLFQVFRECMEIAEPKATAFHKNVVACLLLFIYMTTPPTCYTYNLVDERPTWKPILNQCQNLVGINFKVILKFYTHPGSTQTRIGATNKNKCRSLWQLDIEIVTHLHKAIVQKLLASRSFV